MLQLYKNIKARRLELGMTQTELAQEMGYADKSMIAKIEKGAVDLPQSKISMFAQKLNTTPAQLMGWISDEDIANVFYEDMVFDELQKMRSIFSKQEVSHFEKYIKLNDISKKKVDKYTQNLLSNQVLENELLNAAHARTDIEIPDNIDTSDDDIMDDENF